MKTLFWLAALSMTLISNAHCQSPSDYVPDVWTTTGSFVKRIDSGIASPLVDPKHPPTLELIFLSWIGGRLSVTGDYHNLTSTPIQVKGREIVDSLREGLLSFATWRSPMIRMTLENAGLSPSPVRGVKKRS